MQKFTSLPNPNNLPCSTIKFLFSFFSSLPETQHTNSVLPNYLTESFNFPKSRALALSKRYSSVKSIEQPQNVCQFFRNIGFSDSQIQSTVRLSPQVLLCDVDKTLKPKIEFFQNLGVARADLGELISKNTSLLLRSLEKKLIPFVEILKQVLKDDKNNENLIRSLRRCNWHLIGVPESRLLSNIEFFKSCGIVGSQLSMLLLAKPAFFAMPEFKLKKLVSFSDMGFSINSRMFVHGLRALGNLGEGTFERKLELFRGFGFSRDEFVGMFRKSPTILTYSDKSLKSRLEFFLNKVELEKEVLFNRPQCFSYNMENRLIPRYRVFKIVMSRRLLKKKCSFPPVLDLTEEKFLQKFVWRFGDDAEELLLAYKGQSFSSSSSSKEES